MLVGQWRRLLSSPHDHDGNKTAPVLLVIAHPDDEAMFFGPLLLALQSNEIKVHILSLSNGNADGIGHVRETELLASATVFGVSSDAVHIVKHHSLQDGVQNIWPVEVIAKLITEYSRVICPQLIISFDGYGVSGHANHIATYKGTVLAYHQLKELGLGIKGITLESVSWFRKFIGLLDILFSLHYDRSHLLVIQINLLAIIAAMTAHHSQFVWFRKLFVVFTRYSYVNSFKEMH